MSLKNLCQFLFGYFRRRRRLGLRGFLVLIHFGHDLDPFPFGFTLGLYITYALLEARPFSSTVYHFDYRRSVRLLSESWCG